MRVCRLMRRVAALVLSLAALPAPALDADNVPSLARSGDVLQFGVPVTAFVLTFFLDHAEDGDAAAAQTARIAGAGALEFDLALTGSPRRDLVVALARTEMATYGLKYSVNAERPNGGPNSFPSGHTAAAFTGAEFIRKQYGGVPGIAAYGAAAFVGWTRVVSRAHWTHDVLAGAAIGILSNHDALRWQGTFGQFSISPGFFAPVNYEFEPAEPAGPRVLPTLQFRFDF